MSNDLTIVVNSCDTYSDLWEPFFALLKKFWNKCEYPIVLNTEHKEFQYDNLKIRVVNLPEKTVKHSLKYGARLKNVLNQVCSEYILLMLDDFFIRSEVKSQVIEECLSWMDKDQDIAYISFESVDDPLNIKDEKHPDFVLRPQYGDYKINLQAGIWRRKKLLAHLHDNESPWDFELLGNIRTFTSRMKYYALDSTSDRVINYRKNDGRFPYKWSIVGGKWVVDTVADLFKENGIEIDFSLRGIYTEKDFAKDQCSSIQYTKVKLLKSIGIINYFKIYKWGYIQKFSQFLLKKKLPPSYLEYKRNKITNNQRD